MEENPQKGYKIKDLPRIERPRERLISKGPQNLKDEELLAIFAIIVEAFIIVAYNNTKSHGPGTSGAMVATLVAHVILWVLIIISFIAYLINSSIFAPIAEVIEETGPGVIIKAIIGIIIGIWFSSPAIVALLE